MIKATMHERQKWQLVKWIQYPWRCDLASIQPLNFPSATLRNLGDEILLRGEDLWHPNFCKHV
jgi:hypothetical protein